MLGAGHRDVREPSLLPLAVRRPVCGERIERVAHAPLIGRARIRERGQADLIAAQRERQHTEPAQVVVGSVRLAGQDALGETGNRHDVPLQPFRRMRGQHLHRALDQVRLTRIEPALLRLGRLEEREKGRQRRALRLAGEPRGRLRERVEVRPREPGVTGPHRDFDVKTHLPLDVGHQIGQRLVQS